MPGGSPDTDYSGRRWRPCREGAGICIWSRICVSAGLIGQGHRWPAAVAAVECGAEFQRKLLDCFRRALRGYGLMAQFAPVLVLALPYGVGEQVRPVISHALRSNADVVNGQN